MKNTAKTTKPETTKPRARALKRRAPEGQGTLAFAVPEVPALTREAVRQLDAMGAASHGIRAAVLVRAARLASQMPRATAEDIHAAAMRIIQEETARVSRVHSAPRPRKGGGGEPPKDEPKPMSRREFNRKMRTEGVGPEDFRRVEAYEAAAASAGRANAAFVGERAPKAPHARVAPPAPPPAPPARVAPPAPPPAPPARVAPPAPPPAPPARVAPPAPPPASLVDVYGTGGIVDAAGASQALNVAMGTVAEIFRDWKRAPETVSERTMRLARAIFALHGHLCAGGDLPRTWERRRR